MNDPYRDFERCYRAVSARDARFDGQFITAVHTTGIYCRPSCPARTPLQRNVSFFPTAAAAQQAGFRACRRCLPDAAPGSPLWNTRSDLAARAMRLIADGVVDRDGVTGLAGALAYSPRQLTRTLTAELGAGPLALARAHRAHTGRMLLERTSLPMSEIAYAAGFSSIRQFNDTIGEVFAATPTQLRGTGGAIAPGGQLQLRLPFRQPLDRPWLAWFFGAHAVPGLESWDGASYSRIIPTPHGSTTATLTLHADHVQAALVLPNPRDLAPALSRLRHLLDLDADPVGIAESLTGTAFVPGLRLPGNVDGSELLLRTMIGQQISVAAARAHTARLVAALGTPVAGHGAVRYAFPTAAVIAERGHEVLTGPKARIAAIISVAGALAQDKLVLHAGCTAADLRRELLSYPGIGPWTADYVTMRLLADPDILLSSDLVVRRGAALAGLDLRDSGRWAPWRSYLSIQLWALALGVHTSPQPKERTA